MKKCPVCSTTYTDDTLRFCLADGAMLESAAGSTPALGNGGRSSRTWLKILIGLLAFGALLLAVAGVAGILFYTASRPAPEISRAVSPTPSATPSEDAESRRLQEELANLQKRLEQQDSTAANAKPFPEPDGEERGSSVTATVDSPGDGFLALRSEPSVETGLLLVKIPHRAQVELNNCEKKQITVGGRAGRWCLVTYQEHTGYVFDGWLEY